MVMKKSKMISLVLITSALASCHTTKPSEYRAMSDPLYYENDSTESCYDPNVYQNVIQSNPWHWYYSFRPYGSYCRVHGRQQHVVRYASLGTWSGRIASSGKIATVRGGFGKAMSASS